MLREIPPATHAALGAHGRGTEFGWGTRPVRGGVSHRNSVYVYRENGERRAPPPPCRLLACWIVATAELKFRADDEAEAFEEAERKRRLALWHEYMEEYQAEFGAFTEEEMAEAAKRRQEAHRRAEEYWARNGLYTSDPGDLRKLCEATGFKALVVGY